MFDITGYIKSYKLVYREKLEEISRLQRNVELGLSKLDQVHITHSV